MKVYPITIKQAHSFLVEINDFYFAIDASWPCHLYDYLREMKRTGLEPKKIRYLLVTHFHMDHAGLVEELKNLGTEFLVLADQVPFIQPMEEQIARSGTCPGYQPIDLETSKIFSLQDLNDFLLDQGIPAQVIPTKGHSEDSISIVFKDGTAFVGDLYKKEWLTTEDYAGQASWQALAAAKATKIYHAHGEIPQDEHNT
ncbi:beta-lactamase [Enterococcus canis]|uniref:Beta-lactamase n=1 Tax=Enterococcus canis TaxID=214095 RepID=A0A1L8RHH9_9ENTE|nr:MBL fold metallo-hydrolase [Enterococcus canis]OJG19239.1 beta-lactamase [Enterococcus canis]